MGHTTLAPSLPTDPGSTATGSNPSTPNVTTVESAIVVSPPSAQYGVTLSGAEERIPRLVAYADIETAPNLGPPVGLTASTRGASKYRKVVSSSHLSSKARVTSMDPAPAGETQVNAVEFKITASTTVDVESSAYEHVIGDAKP